MGNGRGGQPQMLMTDVRQLISGVRDRSYGPLGGGEIGLDGWEVEDDFR